MCDLRYDIRFLRTKPKLIVNTVMNCILFLNIDLDLINYYSKFFDDFLFVIFKILQKSICKRYNFFECVIFL